MRTCFILTLFTLSPSFYIRSSMIVCLWVPLKCSSPAALQPSATASPPAHRSPYTGAHPSNHPSIRSFVHPPLHPCYISHLNMHTDGHFIPFTLFGIHSFIWHQSQTCLYGSEKNPTPVHKYTPPVTEWIKPCPLRGVDCSRTVLNQECIFFIPNSWPKHKNTWFNLSSGLFQKWSEKVFPFSSNLHIWAIY